MLNKETKHAVFIACPMTALQTGCCSTACSCARAQEAGRQRGCAARAHGCAHPNNVNSRMGHLLSWDTQTLQFISQAILSFFPSWVWCWEAVLVQHTASHHHSLSA